jgi:hypothetical protein
MQIRRAAEAGRLPLKAINRRKTRERTWRSHMNTITVAGKNTEANDEGFLYKLGA